MKEHRLSDRDERPDDIRRAASDDATSDQQEIRLDSGRPLDHPSLQHGQEDLELAGRGAVGGRPRGVAQRAGFDRGQTVQPPEAPEWQDDRNHGQGNHQRSHAANSIADILVGIAPTLTDEYDLQTALAAALTDAGYDVAREVNMYGRDGKYVGRIDVVVRAIAHGWAAADIAIEVKVDGALSAVTRQLERYAKCAEISELILVTTRAKHHNIPRELHGKPVHLVSLVEGGL